MLWLAWRQHRTQVLVALAFLVVVGGALLAHGLRAAGVVDAFPPGSESRKNVLGQQFGQVSRLLIWSVLAPTLVGLFWGAPLLAREYERGTHRLAWAQSVTRRGWLGVKLVGLSAAVTVAGALFGVIMGAWAGGFGELRLAGRLANLDLFVVTGIAPAAWWLFAFALGVAAGAVTLKLLPAMAVTVAVFLVAYVGMFAAGVRQHYAPPVRVEKAAPVVAGDPWAINTPPGAATQLPAGALMVRSGWVDPRGAEVTGDATWGCASTSDDYLSCMRDKGFRWYAEYQPADRYWRFQWTEAGLLLAAAIALGGVAWFRVTRH
jgi:hypothetical protein